MEALFHFLFVLIKISILGCIYATLTLIIFRIIGYYKSDSWFSKVSKKKFRFWVISGFVISVSLFFFMFTYFGDHGLGDSAKVPIGHFKVVNQINGTDAYIKNSKDQYLGISKFTFDHQNLYAKTKNGFNNEDGDYVVWDLKTDNWTFYQTESDYLKSGHPTPDGFQDFRTAYEKHWHGWRFFLLP